jgi:signal transduction histidine kinase
VNEEQPTIDRWPVGATAYAVVVSTLIATLVLVHLYPLHGPRVGLFAALVWQGGIYGTWGLLVPVIARLARTAPHRGARLTLGGVVLIPLHAAFSVLLGWRMRSWPRPPWGTLSSAFHSLFLDRAPIDMLVYLAIVGALLARRYAAEARQRGVAAAEAEALLARARLESLSARLQPHFLFNALQAIATLIRRDPDAATAMTVRLGDLLRASLRTTGEQRVLLRDELALVRAYLEVESARFSDRLKVRFEIDDAALDCRVPDLLLQPLVENAVRHGISPRPDGGTIVIRARREGNRLELAITDDGVGIGEPEVGDLSASTDGGVGLAATRERLAVLYGSRASLSLERGQTNGATARLSLPAESGDPPTR